MDKTSNEQSDTLETIGPVEVEWQPLEHELNLNRVADHEVGKEGEATLKARCKRCWGMSRRVSIMSRMCRKRFGAVYAEGRLKLRTPRKNTNGCLLRTQPT